MTEDLLTRARELAVYIIENRATIRQAAKHFGLSKSTVHKDLSERRERNIRGSESCRFPGVFPFFGGNVRLFIQLAKNL